MNNAPAAHAGQGSEEKTEQVTRSSATPPPGFSRTVHTERHSYYLGQQVLELIFGERNEESRDDSLQISLRHRLVVVPVEYLEDFLYVIPSAGNLLS